MSCLVDLVGLVGVLFSSFVFFESASVGLIFVLAVFVVVDSFFVVSFGAASVPSLDFVDFVFAGSLGSDAFVGLSVDSLGLVSFVVVLVVILFAVVVASFVVLSSVVAVFAFVVLVVLLGAFVVSALAFGWASSFFIFFLTKSNLLRIFFLMFFVSSSTSSLLLGFPIFCSRCSHSEKDVVCKSREIRCLHISCTSS